MRRSRQVWCRVASGSARNQHPEAFIVDDAVELATQLEPDIELGQG